MNEVTAMPAIQSFGVKDGQEIKAYTLKNKTGAFMVVLNYGGIVKELWMPDKNGVFANIVLGFTDMSGYTQPGNPFIGALIGRFANRIAGAAFSIDGTRYQLTRNEGENILHAGNKGFHNVIWNVKPLSENSIELSYLSADGDDGFPGNLQVKVVYTLTDQYEWIIDYTAATDRATPISMTQHSYFNLNGFQPVSHIKDHELWLNAPFYTPLNEANLPVGTVETVKGTVFDFTHPTALGSRLNSLPGGFDHNLVFTKDRNPEEPTAIVKDPVSGRVMKMFTTEPAVQLFTAGILNGTLKYGSHALPYQQYAGLCLEAQQYPDAPNQPDFPNTILKPGETYYQKTTYKWTVEN